MVPEATSATYYALESGQAREAPRLVTALLLVWWLLTMVDSAWPQAQMALLGGRVLLGMWPLNLLLLAAIAVMLPRRRLDTAPAALWIGFCVFGAYLMISLPFLEARQPGSIHHLPIAYYRGYFPLFMIPLAYLASGTLDAAGLRKILFAVFLPIAGLGIWQNLADDPILPTVATTGNFQVYAFRLQGEIRSFSLFNSGWSFGHFAAFIGVLGLLSAFVGTRRLHPLVALLLFALAMICIYFSRTRTAYLVGACAVLSAVLVAATYRSGRSRALIGLPLLFALIGLMVAIGVKDLLSAIGLEGSGLFNVNSLNYRHEAWSAWGGVWLDSGWANALFGTGITQQHGGGLMSESTILIDNVFLSVGLSVGLVGLTLWIGFMWIVWSTILGTAYRRDDALAYAIAAVWATWPLSLMFGSGSEYYFLLAILMVLTSPASSDDEALPSATEAEEIQPYPPYAAQARAGVALR